MSDSLNETQRVVVIGNTGSGKSTLAGRLAQTLGVPYIELDALFWGVNWTKPPDEEFLTLVEEATGTQSWVLDGNYSRTRTITWPRADTIVWLDYPLPLILWRLWRRTWRRWWRREVLWNGNRERLWIHFFSRDSLFLWALKTYKRRKREIPAALSKPEFSHLKLIHFHSPSQAEKWFTLLAVSPLPDASC